MKRGHIVAVLVVCLVVDLEEVLEPGG